MNPPMAGGEGFAETMSNEELLRARGFEIMRTWKPQGLIRRMLVTWRHFLGLLFGALVSQLDTRTEDGNIKGWRLLALWIAALPGRLFVDRSLRKEPFPVQLRRRLERLGPTYIKLGQILSLREDLLPKPITDELKHLLNRLPVVPLPVLQDIIEKDLRRPVGLMFLSIDHPPGLRLHRPDPHGHDRGGRAGHPEGGQARHPPDAGAGCQAAPDAWVRGPADHPALPAPAAGE